MVARVARLVPQFVDGKCSFMRTLKNGDVDAPIEQIIPGNSIREAVSTSAKAKDMYEFILNNFIENYQDMITQMALCATKYSDIPGSVMYDRCETLMNNKNNELIALVSAGKRLLSKYH